MLVTGAGNGIGRAAATRMADEGAEVVCLDLAEADAEVTAAAIRAQGGNASAVSADVTQPESIQAALLASGCAERLDTVAHAAGSAAMCHALDQSSESWRAALDTNLTGTFHVNQAVLPPLLDGGGGAVVNVSSIAALQGRPYLAAYSAAKGGIVALTRALAVEFAGQGVRFCCVCPGSVDTRLRAGMVPPQDASQDLLGRGRALLAQTTASPEEVAAAIAYLGSDEARFATGTILVLDGGALA